MNVQRVRINDMIRISPLRVIGPENEQLGVIELDEAKRIAAEKGMDLVEIAADSRPPVCKIMDYGRFKYEQSKREHKARAGNKKSELKEVRLGRSMRIDPHDVQRRVDQARAFLMEGHKVQFVQPFRGREMQFREKGFERMRGIEQSLADIGKVEMLPKFNGRRMIMIVAPDKPRIRSLKAAAEQREGKKASEAEKENEAAAIVDSPANDDVTETNDVAAEANDFTEANDVAETSDATETDAPVEAVDSPTTRSE